MKIIRHGRVGDIMDKLVPDGLWSIPDDTDELTVTSGTYSTTIEEVNELVKAEIAKEKSLQYREDRKYLYPSIGDQLDALYHAGSFTDEMAAKIKAVKDAYPKP
tara:strand:+ start:655 stop:966 length:312 start_codon:yes stop_codon:yes gene_type:complete